MKIALRDVEGELSRLWEVEAQRWRTSRVELVTLVTVVAHPDLLGRAVDVIDHIGAGLPSRAIVAAWQAGDGEAASLDAEISLRRGEERAASGDAIVIRAHGRAREWVPSSIEHLLLSGVPVLMWWVGDLGSWGELFERLIRSADLLVVNSEEMGLPELRRLSEVTRARKATCGIADLTWARLGSMRELVARFFDDAALLPHLDRLSRVTVAFSPRASAPDVASPEAALFVGWLATSLGFLPESARWTHDANGGEVTLFRSGNPEPVVVRVDRERREDVPDGSLLRIELACGDARFRIMRHADDPCLIRCDGHAPLAVVPTQVLRAHFREEPRLLMRYLQRPLRDPLFEASLEIAMRIFFF